MLNAFYATLFKPGDPRLSQATPVGPLIGLLVLLILTLNAAGRFHLGATGLVALMLLFLGAGLLGLFWLTAAITLMAQWFGGRGTATATAQAIAQGLWPLLLSGSAIAATRVSPALATLLSLGVTLGTGLTLAGSIRQAHQLNWLTTYLCLLLVLGASGLALLGLIVWPLMLFAGT